MWFWIGLGVSFLAGLTFPVAVFWTLPSGEAKRWVQNNPSFNLFLLTSFPLAVGTVASVFRVEDFTRLHLGTRVLLSIILIGLLFLALYLVTQDLRRGPLDVYMLRVPLQALRLEKSIREAVRSDTKVEDDARKRYDVLVRPFSSIGDLRKRGSIVAYAALGLNAMAAGFCIVTFWYIAILVISEGKVPPRVLDNLILTHGLMVTWFPMRLYSEWYRDFYSLDRLKTYHAFWMLGVVTIFALMLLIFLLKPGLTVLIFSSLNAVFLSLLGFLGKMKPVVLRYAADVMEGMPFSYYLASEAIMLFALAAMTITIVG